MKLNNEVTKSSPFQSYLLNMAWIANQIWFEGEQGFGSMILDENDIWSTMIDAYNAKEIKLPFTVPHLSHKIIVIPRGGIPLRNLGTSSAKLHLRIGIIQVNFKGTGYRILWGLPDNAPISAYLNQILQGHNACLETNPKHRVLTYCYPSNLEAQALFDSQQKDSIGLEKRLWKASPNLSLWLPSGLAIKSLNGPFISAVTNDWLNLLANQKAIIFPGQGFLLATNDWDANRTILENIDKSAWKLAQWPNDWIPHWPITFDKDLAAAFKSNKTNKTPSSVPKESIKNETN